MKTQKKDSRITTIFKSIFNVRVWLDYERLKAYTLYLTGMAKKLVVPNQEKKKEKEKDFSKTVSGLNLSEKDLEERSKALYRWSMLMCTFALGLFGYAIYQIITGTARAFVLSLIVGLIALVMGFRYHFWYFQIKERKLGCTFKEWYRNGILGDK